MNTLLNLALLIIGTLATLAAFGGKTWEEGHQPLFERINRRGWISLTCLVLAFALGALKEVQNQKQDIDQRRKADDEHTYLLKQLEGSNHSLDLANSNLVGLGKLLAATEGRLQDTRMTLDDLRARLRTTTSELNAGNATSILTELATSNQHIREVSVLVPLTESGNRSQIARLAMLPRFPSRECLDRTTLNLGIDTPETFETTYFRPGDTEVIHEYFSGSSPKADAVFRTESPSDKEMLRELVRSIGQKSSNDGGLILATHFANHSSSAARLYGDLSTPGFVALRIEATWQPPHKAVRPGTIIGRAGSQQILLPPSSSLPPYPPACVLAIRKYFQVAFSRAMFSVTLDQTQHESLTFRLRSLPPVCKSYSCMVSFAVFSIPFVRADDEFESMLDVRWPDGKDSRDH